MINSAADWRTLKPFDWCPFTGTKTHPVGGSCLQAWPVPSPDCLDLEWMGCSGSGFCASSRMPSRMVQWPCSMSHLPRPTCLKQGWTKIQFSERLETNALSIREWVCCSRWADHCSESIRLTSSRNVSPLCECSRLLPLGWLCRSSELPCLSCCLSWCSGWSLSRSALFGRLPLWWCSLLISVDLLSQWSWALFVY